MRRLHAALMSAVFASSSASSASAQVITLSDTGRTLISATGTARQLLVPNRATVMLLIEPPAMSVEEAANRLASAEKAVLDTLRQLSIPASAIQNFNSGVAPYRSNMSSNMNAPQFAGRSMIRVDVARLDQLAAITSAALAKGATSIGPATYAQSSADSVRHALIPQAYQQALREAETLARAAGGRLGRLIDVTMPAVPNFSDQVQNVFFNNASFDNGQRSVPTSTITVTVTTRWVLIPNR